MTEVEGKQRVCVTGAGGYLASWVIKFLLSKGYMVHGTVRDPGDMKNAHLTKLENASENLQLFKADLLDYEGLCAATDGCTGVFHVACPVPARSNVPNPEVELIEPAVTGTRNVLNACTKAKVKRVVVVSSIGAVVFNRSWPKDRPMDEECWSETELCKAVQVTPIRMNSRNIIALAKRTVAESEALEYAKSSEFSIITVCPSIIIGPLLQPTMNASSLFLLTLLKGGIESLENKARPVVDVRDVAEALLLAYEKPEANGRYICTSYVIRMQDLVNKLKSLYPNYNYPKSFTAIEEDVKMSSEKLQNLGWKYRPLDETIVDAVKRYEESGFLSKDQDYGTSHLLWPRKVSNQL